MCLEHRIVSIILVVRIACFGICEDVAYFHFGSNENNGNWKSRVAKYVDIYTNHEDMQEVLDNYERVFTKQNPRNYPDVSDRSDTLHFQNFDSIFPSTNLDYYVPVEQTTENYYKPTDNYVFIQSQKVSSNYHQVQKHQRPNFQTSKYNRTIDKPSFIQKIPKPLKINEEVTTETTRYAELEMSKQPASNGSKKIINNMLKRFLAQLYAQKFNTTQTTHKLKSPKYDVDEEKSKFLTSDKLWALKNKTMNKFNKFSIFTIIKFNNTQCNATSSSGSYLGVCYTTTECSNLGGTPLGNCADGYGVCCVFRGSCGGWSNQNCSYFESPNYPNYYPDGGGTVPPATMAPVTDNPNTPDPRLPFWFYQDTDDVDDSRQATSDQLNFDVSRQNSDALSCTFQVYKTSPDVKQFRIDFLDLELGNPTDGTCTDERLVISGQGITSQPPILCGYNTGQHVYVDVTTLMGPVQLMVLSNSGMQKRFRIRICQQTDSCSTQSANCLQYYMGTMGVIESFNYDQAAMLNRSSPGYLNNLNYAICIRREAGYCSVTYTNVMNGVENPFQLTNVDGNGDLTVPMGEAGADILNCPDDYIVIDGTRLCGDRFNDGSMVTDFTMNAPVTDTSTGPIVIQVRTNGNVTGLGFKLYFMQNPCPAST